ncbi:MAG: DUF1566 domain-containing protein [Deltaproteobacteria bacterium]|nr:DUF1566 domain-containing protein [Deltaproteobacteria bacterium]
MSGTQFGATAADRASQVKNGNPASLTDGSNEGDWRLPSLKELSTLKTGAECILCSGMYLFTGVQSDYYWSCSTDIKYPSNGYGVFMPNGGVFDIIKTVGEYVWPVRGGQ